MKKNIFTGMSKAAVSAVLITAITAAPVFAATGDIWKGTTNIGPVVNVLLNQATFLDLVTNPGSYAYEVDGLGYSVTAADAVFDANAGATASAVQAKIKAQLTGTPVVAGTLTVQSVSAINATQVEAKFSGEVATAAAQTLTNYSLGGANPAAAALQTDNKTVILTFTAAQVQVTNAAFVIEPIASKADASKLTTRYAGLFTAEDKTAPAIKEIECKTNLASATSITVKFSEPVQSVGTVKINGEVKTPTGFVAGATQAVFNGLSLDATKTHTIQIVGLTDRATTANVAGVLSSTFSVTKDAVAPIATLSAKGDHTIVVTFDKAMAPATVTAGIPAGTTAVKDEILGTVNTGVATVVPNTDNKQWTINVVTGLYTDKTSRTLTVVFPETITDVLGNKMTATTKQVTLSKDTVAPVITGASFVKNSAGEVTEIRATVSEGLVTGAVTPSNTNVTIVDERGVLVLTTAFLAGISPDAAVADGDTELQFPVTTPAKLSGKYTFTFAKDFASDMAQTANTSATATFTLDFGTASAPDFTLAAGNANIAGNVITVNYTDAVYGGSEVAYSAVNLANYTLNGAALPAGTTATLNTAMTQVEITLPAGSVAKTDTGAVFAINNVKKQSGAVIKPFNKVITITDNTKPVLTSAVLNSDNTITFGFSEELATPPAVGDLIVKVNGKTLDITGLTPTTGTGLNAGKYVIDLSSRIKYDGAATTTFIDVATIAGTVDAGDIVIDNTADVSATLKFTTSPVITSMSLGSLATGTSTAADAATNPLVTKTVISVK